jgi:glucosamine--fructose-6-phosphate aminotransferase (isomerizing)
VTTQMLTEIREQPAALARTLARLDDVRSDLATLAASVSRVAFYARGTSDAAAVYGRYLAEVHAGVPAALGAVSVATLYDVKLDLTGTLVVVLSQSGRTVELVEAAAWARECGARVLAVTNEADSALAGAADLAITTAAGPEIAVPATKTYTAQLLTMAALAEALAPSKPLPLASVPEQVERLLASITEDRLGEVAEALSGASGLAVTGRGLSLTTAVEIALKVEETCGMPTLGLSSADLQHGPVAVLGPDVPLIVAAGPDGPTLPGLASLATAAKTRGAYSVVIGGDASLVDLCSAALPGPDLPEALAPIANVVPGQMLAEALARRRGINPDTPHGLTKVTQTG